MYGKTVNIVRLIPKRSLEVSVIKVYVFRYN